MRPVVRAHGDQRARAGPLALAVRHDDVDDLARERLPGQSAPRHHQRVVERLLRLEPGLFPLPGGQLVGGGDRVVASRLRRLTGDDPVAVAGEGPAVACPPLLDVRALRQLPQQVQALPHLVPGGQRPAPHQLADLPLGRGERSQPVVGLEAVLRGGQRGTRAVVALDGRGEQLVVERRVGRRTGRRAPQLPVGATRELRPQRRPRARLARRRGDPGELGPQVLVLQAGLPGRPVPAQELRHRRQQRGAGHPGPLPEMGQPPAEQRHARGCGMRCLRVLLRRPPEAHGAAQEAHEVDAGAARDDQLGRVRAQLDLDLDAFPGLRVGLVAFGGLDDVGIGVEVRQDDVGQFREEREPQVAVARLRHHEQTRRVPVGAHQRAQGAPASPAVVSGTNTSGRSETCRCRTVAVGRARPVVTASRRARVVISDTSSPGPRRAVPRPGAGRPPQGPVDHRPRRAPPRGRPRPSSGRPVRPARNGRGR